jgi:hypothetical protein
VLELPFAPGSWIVITPEGLAGPFYLPGSHAAWRPIATCESYAGSTRCNRSAYRFERLRFADPGGTWRVTRRTSTLRDPGWRVRRHGPSSFSAAAS